MSASSADLAHALAPMPEKLEPNSIPSVARDEAAQAVYAIPELRAKILQLLGPADLARSMRVHKDGMEAVARELYGSLRYNEVFARLMGSAEVYLEREKPSDSRLLYASTVHTIDARQLKLSPAMIRDLGVDLRKITAPDEKARIASWESIYYAMVFSVVVSALRKVCPNVRTIYFGSKSSDHDKETWSVSLVPSPLQSGETQGHITHHAAVHLHPHDMPPKSLHTTPTPPDGYIMTSAFSLKITTNKRPLTAAQSQRWLLALREDAVFEKLGGAIDLGGLPATFDDLIATQRHSVARLPLEIVSTPSLVGWSMDGFRAFAGVFPALRTLQLGPANDYIADSPKPSFAELPQFFSIIRESLPRLRSLRIPVSGIETAEAFFLPLLKEAPATDLPALQSITLVTALHLGNYFNILRWLSQQGKNVSKVFMNKMDNLSWDQQAQKKFLQYIQGQAPEQRKYLNTINFSTIHISHPENIPFLTYSSDGQPIRFGVAKTAEWRDQTQQDAEHVRAEILPNITDLAVELADASARLSDIAAHASPEHLLDKARSLHHMAQRNRSRITSLLQDLLKRTEETEEDIGWFVQAMAFLLAQKGE